jgi:hypothetical protein
VRNKLYSILSIEIRNRQSHSTSYNPVSEHPCHPLVLRMLSLQKQQDYISFYLDWHTRGMRTMKRCTMRPTPTLSLLFLTSHYSLCCYPLWDPSTLLVQVLRPSHQIQLFIIHRLKTKRLVICTPVALAIDASGPTVTFPGTPDFI